MQNNHKVIFYWQYYKWPNLPVGKDTPAKYILMVIGTTMNDQKYRFQKIPKQNLILWSLALGWMTKTTILKRYPTKFNFVVIGKTMNDRNYQLGKIPNKIYSFGYWHYHEWPKLPFWKDTLAKFYHVILSTAMNDQNYCCGKIALQKDVFVSDCTGALAQNPCSA